MIWTARGWDKEVSLQLVVSFLAPSLGVVCGVVNLVATFLRQQTWDGSTVHLIKKRLERMVFIRRIDHKKHRKTHGFRL